MVAVLCGGDWATTSPFDFVAGATIETGLWAFGLYTRWEASVPHGASSALGSGITRVATALNKIGCGGDKTSTVGVARQGMGQRGVHVFVGTTTGIGPAQFGAGSFQDPKAFGVVTFGL